MKLGGDWRIGCLKRNTIKHEILHSLGIYHQHQRSDRDKYVDIMWKNINENRHHNFDNYDERTVDTHDIPYDFMSILHYDEYYFSNYSNFNNTNVTIRTHDRNTQGVASWTEKRYGGPRLTDIELVRRMYKCDQIDLARVELPDEMPNKDSECKYFAGIDRIPTTLPLQDWYTSWLAERPHLEESWYNCKKLCFDNPECTEWTINHATGACSVGKGLMQKVLSQHLKWRSELH